MSADFYAEIGTRIRRLRESRGWTQAQLSEVLDVATPTVSRYETATKHISLDTLRRIAATFSVPLASLVDTFRDTPPPTKPRREPSGLEAKMLRAWRALTPEQKKRALAILRALGR